MWKWLALVVAFLVIEFWPGHTLSEELWAFTAAHPWAKVGVVAIGVLITGHLAFQWIKTLRRRR